MGNSLGATERNALHEQLERLIEEATLEVLDPRRIEALSGCQSEGEPIVSLYLDLGPQARLKRGWGVALKSMAKEALAGVDDERAEAVETMFGKIERALEERLPELGRGVAIFACDEIDLYEMIALPVALRNRLELGPRPVLRPLLRVRDEHDLYVVVLLDKRRARLFLNQHGVIHEVFDLFEDTPSHQKQGGWSQMRFQRNHDAHVLWHAAAVAEATTLLLDRFVGKHLLVSGTDEVLAEYREHLPAAAAEKLDGTFSVAIDAPAVEILEAIAPSQREVEADEERARIGAIHDAVSSGKGVWGLSDTLRALTEQRVRALVCSDRFRAHGARCPHCGMLSPDSEGECPSCEHDLEPVEDVVDLALERAFGQDAEIELVRSEPAKALLEEAAPIGALLRY